MISSTQMQSYKSHELDIKIQTSSGDTVNLNMQNMSEMLYESQKQDGSSKSSLSFSSMQEFNFKVASENGIDDQDKKEIEEFMKIAKPFIDNFMKELDDQKQTTPINKITKSVEDIFAPVKEKSLDTQNFAKNQIVKLFDNALKMFQDQQSKMDDSQKLLTKILDSFDQDIKSLYA
jgi:hypothetical protein